MSRITVIIDCPKCNTPINVTWSYWPGVRYYPDGSGQPPEEDISCDHDCGEYDDDQQVAFDLRLTMALGKWHTDNPEPPEEW